MENTVIPPGAVYWIDELVQYIQSDKFIKVKSEEMSYDQLVELIPFLEEKKNMALQSEVDEILRKINRRMFQTGDQVLLMASNEQSCKGPAHMTSWSKVTNPNLPVCLMRLDCQIGKIRYQHSFSLTPSPHIYEGFNMYLVEVNNQWKMFIFNYHLTEVDYTIM